MQKHRNLVDLVKSFPTKIYNSLANVGVDTAENEPLKVHLIFKLWDLIFTEPLRPTISQLLGAELVFEIRDAECRTRNMMNYNCL